MQAAEEGTPPAEAELSAMKVKALKKRAKELGVDEEKLEDADDAGDVKRTVIALILEKEKDSALERLRAELEHSSPRYGVWECSTRMTWIGMGSSASRAAVSCRKC